MRFISTKVHGLLDWVMAIVLIASPWIFQFDHGSVETWLPILLGGGALLYSVFTDYEWSVARRIPMWVHLLLDVCAGLLLAVSPWLFGFASVVSTPHLALGVTEIVVALLTSTHSTDHSYTGTKPYSAAILALLLPLTGCARDESDTYTVVTLAGQQLEITDAANHIASIPGFHGPESVRYDPEQDVFFVSNMHGPGSDKDDAGYIVRVAAGDYSKADLFIESGHRGAKLNAPKGLVIRDSVLWVADIDVVRGFDRRTGAVVGVVDLKPLGATLLNDIALGPDGNLYVTDTGINMTAKASYYIGGDRIFAIDSDGAARVVAEGPHLALPNGITWDSAGTRWIVASFNPFESVLYELPRDMNASAPTVLARGPGRFDGVEILNDGSIVVTCWTDYSVHWIRGGEHLRIVGNIHQPADLGIDTRRNRLLIPSAILGRVEVWQLRDS